MKNGLKKSAPETPEPIATVEKAMDAGKTHHSCENVCTGFVLSLPCNELPCSFTHWQVT